MKKECLVGVLFLILCSAVLSHSDTELEIDTTFERYLLSEKEIDENLKHKTTVFDYILNFFSNLGAKKKSSFTEEQYVSYLDVKLEKINKVKTKSKIVQARLNEYHKDIDWFLDNTEFSLKTKENKINNDLSEFSTLYKNLDSESKNIAIEISEQEVDFLAQEKNIKELISLTNTCDNLSKSLQFSCYYQVFEEATLKEKDELNLLIENIKEKQKDNTLDTVECHYLHHAIGFLLYQEYGINGISKCPNTYDACSFGCHHGMAELLFYENKAQFESESIVQNKIFREILEANDTYELFNLYHGFGHAFYANMRNIPKAQSFCNLISKNDFTRNMYCFFGMSHEIFSNTVFEDIQIEKASKKCLEFRNNRNKACYYMLGFVYAEQDLKVAENHCATEVSPYCMVGVGAYLDVWPGDADKNKIVSLCEEHMKTEKDMISCLYGAMTTSLYFFNDMTRGYDICKQSKEHEKACLERLRSVYLSTHLVKQKKLCNFVDITKRAACLRDLKKHNISNEMTRIEN